MQTPNWLDTKEYPFDAHFFQTSAGAMHYVDEGSGPPIVFVHGNPSWSFAFRKVIQTLSKKYRCIAPDHIGFGLSDKPKDWSYLPKKHADNFAQFLDSLDLKDITLVVGDWGGPIGLSYALRSPEKIRNLVITNTWLWPIHDNWRFLIFSKFMSGTIGKWLITKHNFFAKNLMKMGFGKKSKLTSQIHRQYTSAFSTPAERKGCWVFPKELIGSTDWLRELRSKRHSLKNKNILLAWGMKDPAFRKKELNRWIKEFPDARVVRYADVGHFVVEEKSEAIVREIEKLF